ncbi:hypothetical protein A3K93_05150 [Acinetobacter sp. NCu2D-2]|uniref:hypothetical protein n=1 Tax=Acinetobacter sp. NCu2D-2 TaxID=1608473 RepID=UPI0007CDFD5F|nr:hypothetical protein [Acinetobacter sp. NCu2D-2]ANF81630.1 hypothetical protein A3K93_05150 [Acinetobacter sp. NCu2D-2]
MVGLAIAVSALGTAYYIATSQKSLVVSHASTNVQSGAWSGVEILKEYLNTLDETGVLALNQQNLKLNVQDGRSLDVKNIVVQKLDPELKQYRVTANIVNVSELSQSSSSIQAVYDVDLQQTPSSSQNPNQADDISGAMNFFGGLGLSGGIVMKDTGAASVINVDGNFSAQSIGLTGVKTINSTGDVTLNSSVSVDNVYANGSIYLSQGAAIQKIASAQKSISVDSWGQDQGAFYANQDILLKGSAVKSADSLSNILISTWSRVGSAIAKKSISCVGTGWNDFDSLQAYAFKNCPSNSKIHNPPLTEPQGAVALVSMNRPLVNALDEKYIQQANYIFKYNAATQRPIVTVQNVNGIPDGDYEIGRYVRNYVQYWGDLCQSVDKDGYCQTPVVGHLYLDASQKQRIKYSNGTWTVDDEVGNPTGQVGSNTAPSIPSIAPGIMLFYGNVSLPRGLFVNTILATGDISYGQSISLYAPNYAGAASVCHVNGYAMLNNICSSTTTLTQLSLANTALLAGSCTLGQDIDLCRQSYTGGTISLGQSAYIFGNIVAGNVLDTSGSSHIVGGVLAAALGNVGQGNKIGNTTTIDFSDLKNRPDFKPSVPGTSDETSKTEDITDHVTLKWSRYL